MNEEHYPLLSGVHSPQELKELPQSRLPALADELRQFLVESVAGSGGHLAAGLGTVELTVALHYVYDTPDDRLVWDVGHQTYPHKVLTGRMDRMDSIRRKGGLSGFPHRDESEFDAFGVGHAGTSVSAALGMVVAAQRNDDTRKVVAIIGDGALTSGMSFEALNHAGHLDADLLVILNDNNMSISPNVGALSSHLTQILSGRLYSSVRESSKKVLSHMPPVKAFARRAEEHVKGMVSPGTLFEELGFHYFGPVDGHDVVGLVKVLRNLRSLSGPRFLHVVTRKGKGYAPAEADPVAYHGVTPFEPEQGLVSSGDKAPPSYTEIFGDWLCDMAAQDERLVGITPAMCEGSGLTQFAEQYPDRYFDVGIAEQHAVTLAAGLACEGQHPVVAIYSTFLQRAYDQVLHDVALQKLPVLFAIDRGGLVGADGATHSGNFDLTYLRCIPEMVIMAPADENECRQMLYTGYMMNRPAAVRYPRGRGPGAAVAPELTALPFGRAELRRKGNDIALLAFGATVAPAMGAAEALDATVVNMRFVKPLDEAMILELADSHRLLVTVEDNVIAGGAGSAVNEFLLRRRGGVSVINLGLPDYFVEHATRDEQLRECGLDAEGILKAVRHYADATASGAGQSSPASRIIHF